MLGHKTEECKARITPADACPPSLSADTWAATMKALRLSPQQARIAGLLLRAWENKAIASELGLSLPTLRTYLDRIYRRAKVSNRVGLVVRLFVLALDHERRQRCPPS